MALHRWRDWPWASKLAFVLVAVAMAPLVAVTYYNDAAARAAFVRDSGTRDLQRAGNTASLIDHVLKDVLGDVMTVALSPLTRDVLLRPGDAVGLPRLSQTIAVVARTKRLALVQVIDHDGVVVAATDPAAVGLSRIAGRFFLRAIAGETSVNEPRYVREAHAFLLSIAVPVRSDHDLLIGVVAARVTLDDIDRVIAEDTGYGGLGEAGLLWDDHGIVLASPAHPSWRFHPLAPLLPYTAGQMAAEGRFGPDTAALLAAAGHSDALVAQSRWRLYDQSVDPHVTTDLPDAGRVRVTSVPVPGTRWTYGIATPEATALAASRAQTSRALAVAGAMGVLAMLLSFVAARWVSRPLGRVQQAAHALAQGDLTRRAGLDRRDEIGELAASFDAMADVIAEKDAELRRHAEALERRVGERTEELSGLLRAVPDLMFKVSADGTVLDYIAAKSEPLAASAPPAAAVIGRHLSDVLPEDVAAAAMARVTGALGGTDAAPYEYSLQAHGEARHYEARVSASGPSTAVVLVRDITERVAAEERARFLAQAGATLAASLDYTATIETLVALTVPFMADLCVIDLLERGRLRAAAVAAADPDVAAAFRRARAAYPVELTSQHPVALALGGKATFVADWQPAAAHAFATSPEHLRVVESIPMTSMMVLPLVAHGRTFGAMSFISTSPARRYAQPDMTTAAKLADRAASALDNARLYHELEDSNRAKDEFLSTVSHELRTPLNAVLGWSQMLRRGTLDAEHIDRAIDAIERNARAQAQLVEDLLDTSRIVSGKVRVAFVETDVADVARTAVESFRPLARGRSCTLDLSTGPDLTPLLVDPTRLQQVIGNLLSNALKFTPAGGRITVTVRRRGPAIEIEVADTGAGISPDFLPYVFDRFRQGDSSTTRVHGGLGLGLSIARHLVELHGGAITAASDGEGKGASFTVVLPIREEQRSRSAGSVVSPSPSPSLAGVRVLVVDDDEDARTLLEALLGAAGARVDTAATAAEAQARITRSRPEVVVSDIGMPGGDGYALVRWIRADDAARGLAPLPCIALTAYARDDDRARAAAAGFDRHLIKPIDPPALLRAIAETLRR